MKSIDLTKKTIGQHKPGKWVALNNQNKLVAEGDTFDEVYEEAVSRGVKEPFVANMTASTCTMIL